MTALVQMLGSIQNDYEFWQINTKSKIFKNWNHWSSQNKQKTLRENFRIYKINNLMTKNIKIQTMRKLKLF